MKNENGLIEYLVVPKLTGLSVDMNSKWNMDANSPLEFHTGLLIGSLAPT